MPAALRLPLPATGFPAGIGCERCLVVLLRFFGDDGKEKLLLPGGRLAGAIKPRIGRLPWTAKGGNDLGGGILGKRFSEGHGQILPQKKKYAMQKINLAKCPQCRQSTHMTKATAQRNIEGITRCIPEVEKSIEEAKASGNKKHEEAHAGYLMSLKRQLEIYKQALK
jgi:hypothetical protein